MIWKYFIIWMMKTSKEIKYLSQVFKIFANEQRLAVVSLLKLKGEKSVGQIADHLEISFKTASKNLLFLTKKGILKRRYDGSFVLYKISDNLLEFTSLIISRLP